MSIRISDENKATRKMTKIKCPKEEIGYLWEARMSFESNSNADVEYKYVLERKYKGSPPIDSPRRAQQGTTNYDSFEKADSSSKVSGRTTICYSKWLFETVDKQNFNARVAAVKNMKFDFHQLDSSSKILKTFVTWIFEQEAKDNVSKYLYLGVLLALVNENNDFDWQRKCDRHSCKRFVDHFLHVLRKQEATVLWNDVKETLVNSLTLLAPKLVNASSFPGWLPYAASFYSYLGVKLILSDSSAFTQGQEYSKGMYEHLVDCLTEYMTRDRAMGVQEEFLQMLERILFDAPDIDAVVSLYGKNTFLNLFHNIKEQTELFGKVLEKKAKDILIHNKGHISKALTKLREIPSKSPIKALFSQILLNFIDLQFNSYADEKEENTSAFCSEMSREDHFSIEEIKSVMHALVKSNQPHCHEIFLRLLTSNFYGVWWEKLGRDQHMSILSKWMTVDLADNTNQPSQCQPCDVFKRARKLEELNIFSAGSIQEACSEGFERRNKNKDQNNFTLASMLEALSTVEGLSSSIQECYKKLFGSMLKNSPAVKEDIVSFSIKKCWFTDTSPKSTQKISR